MNIEKFFIKDRFVNQSSLLDFSYTDPERNMFEHTHEFSELVIVDKGCAVHIFNGELYFIQEGDVFFIKKGDRHCYCELGTLKLMNLYINTRYKTSYITDVNLLLDRFSVNYNHIYNINSKAKNSCLDLIRKTSEINKEKDLDIFRLGIETTLINIVNIIIKNNSETTYNTSRKIRDLLIYLQKNYKEDINWNELSNKFNLTIKTITRRIKEITGMPPVVYLNRLRTLAAREYIKHTDISITDIAGMCGFNSSDYFTKCYKKNFGKSPLDERKNDNN